MEYIFSKKGWKGIKINKFGRFPLHHFLLKANILAGRAIRCKSSQPFAAASGCCGLSTTIPNAVL